MAERMNFPMYAIHRQQTQALWQAVQSLLDERGVMVAGDPRRLTPGICWLTGASRRCC
ncbi:putative ABC phosphate/phosphonate transport system periplasmic ligand-binding component [Klebsiella pneumoniae]|nr:putative ABC phosphate/phosphonate transport system periplasmic ligand-binding component [Klebsiella pneumoniae]